MGMSEKFKAFQVEHAAGYFSGVIQEKDSKITENTTDEELNKIINESKLEIAEIIETGMTKKLNGENLEIFIPFTGSEKTFGFKNINQTFYNNFDIEISILDGKEIVFTVKNVKNKTTEEIKATIAGCVKKFKIGCNNLKESIKMENALLESHFKHRLSDLRKRNKSLEEKLEDLGIPERK